MEFGIGDTESYSLAKNCWISIIVWFILLMNFVSISLLVTLEMVKFAQAYFIQEDYLLFDTTKDMPAKVQSSNLNEELGMIHYIFSDKTGTLTQNIMEFQKFTAGGMSFGKSNPAPFEYPAGVTNVNFEDERVWEILKNPSHPEHTAVNRFVECLGICHTVVSEEKKAKDGSSYLVYNASSPDELALVNGMRHFGFTFRDRDEQDNMVIDKTFTGEVLKY